MFNFSNIYIYVRMSSMYFEILGATIKDQSKFIHL